eukprot:263155-Pyramimonas_sp.AAC.1
MAHVRVEPYLTCLRRLMVSELLWCYDGHVYSLCAASGEVEWAYHMGDQVSADPDRYTFGHVWPLLDTFGYFWWIPWTFGYVWWIL